jgi:hypothetical protein
MLADLLGAIRFEPATMIGALAVRTECGGLQRVDSQSHDEHWLFRRGNQEKTDSSREAQIDHILGENVEIADTDPIVERARLRINARLAWLAKLHARKYR